MVTGTVATANVASSTDTLALVFNHIVLPPKLPGEYDSKSNEVEENLLSRLLDAARKMHDCAGKEDVPVWQGIGNALWVTARVNEGECINGTVLTDVLRKLSSYPAVILRIREQNAGILILLYGDRVLFEAFEASPTAEEALDSKGALQWDFPGAAVSLPVSEVYNDGFSRNIGSFLEKASVESLDEFAAKTRKAGVTISEARDTTDPALITQFLMTLFEVKGSRVHPLLLRKRVKDDVCWDGAELPWRRSPLWLVLRVSVQRMLYLTQGEEKGRVQYKFLMCALLTQLLTDSAGKLDPEKCSFLRAKLCRRLAKLEIEKEAASQAVLPVFTHFFERVGAICKSAIEIGTFTIEAQWNTFRADFRRKIPLLPHRVNGNDLHLTLPNSGCYLQNILHRPHSRTSRQLTVDGSSLGPNSSKGTTELFNSLTSRYSALEKMGMTIESASREVPDSRDECQGLCRDLALQIRRYLNAVGDLYQGYTEQMSTFILNVFELWVHMDKCAIIVHPLLRQYPPCFVPELLDVLLLSRLDDLNRLQSIQQYISHRCRHSRKRVTIFADLQEGCFADRFFYTDEPEEIERLYRLQQHIESASLRARLEKETELQRVNDDYRARTAQMAQIPCTQRLRVDGSHDIRGCQHCWLIRTRRRLGIEAHEDFLPTGNSKKGIIQKRGIIFELDPPAAFSAYRNATWEIINCLCPKITSTQGAPPVLLRDYSQLKMYNRDSARFSLASRTKSYLATHYNFMRLPADSSAVLLPLGLDFSYYDAHRGIWANDLPRGFPQQLTLAHHYALRLPKELAFSNLYRSESFAADGDGPSSYEAVASITECPSELTVHEYTAHQSLMVGRNKRWISILTELASSNVNFSLPDTMILFHHLALQAGPMLDYDNLRAVHVIFRDAAFCWKLIVQIERHTETISENWREIYYMETMLTLTLRLCTVGHRETCSRASGLLLKIRHITLTWINRLRHASRTTQEADIAERTARYGFLSALLCRRTFFPHAYGYTEFDDDSFVAFVEATLAMQENLVVDLSKFRTATLNMLIRDIKMSTRMTSMIRRMVERSPTSLETAINTVWPIPDGSVRYFNDWHFMPSPYEWWITSTVAATMNTVPQTVHYHLLGGHLLVDGKSTGKLPADIRNSEAVKELFGNQRLVAFPSNLPGMNYVLGIQKEDYSVHVGYRDQNLVIQAQKREELLEFIPRSIFGDETCFDLPESLVNDCVHWLDLWTGILEVRRKPKIWRRTHGNWDIDLRTRQAIRRDTVLVNPQSRVFSQVSQIFRHFAEPHMLTVSQPPKGNLSVELKSMNLKFTVNGHSLLQSNQLASEVDPDQDAGTLYGLQSMIVLRDTVNPSQRSIITTLGQLRYRRWGIHVNVKMDNDGEYTRYTIDSILGRLHCPPEPRLLYNKSQLHAFTSFVIPDPLTGRTGTEEALQCLQSGACQPWNPLGPSMVAMLQTIANLTPRRQYYPKDRKRQQNVFWDPHLTATIQHDAYELVVESILSKSDRLWLFQANTPEPRDLELRTIQHLRERAHWRRSIYERPEMLSSDLSPPPDKPYMARRRGEWSDHANNARAILAILSRRPSSLRTTIGLKRIIMGWPMIGSYGNDFVPHLISDCLQVDLAQEWGSLVNICRKCKRENVYDLMFPLGMMAFRKYVDEGVLNTIVAFFLFVELKTLDFPETPSIAGSEIGQKPDEVGLFHLIEATCKPHRSKPFKKAKQDPLAAERLQASEEEYEEKYFEELGSFAKFLAEQWPVALPSIVGFEAACFDVFHAVSAVLPVWRRLYSAEQFSRHIDSVQAILSQRYSDVPYDVPAPASPEVEEVFKSGKGNYDIIPRLSKHILNKACKDVDKLPPSAPRNKRLLFDHSSQWVKRNLAAQLQALSTSGKVDATNEIAELEHIIRPFVRSICSVRSYYASDLELSIHALKEANGAKVSRNMRKIDFDHEIRQAYETLDKHYYHIFDLLACDPRYIWLYRANLWPSMNPMSVLELLRSTSKSALPRYMKQKIVDYAKAMVKVQYLLRMRLALMKNDQRIFRQEYDNPGHTNWDPNTYPDWLLLEIDGNMQIRPDQVTVALAMISPSSGANSVLQMNMGQGKTSVIMPMVASVLADKSMLTRLLVPKALLSQTAQILQSRIGGLLGREITHVPFSRRTPTTEWHVQEYRSLHEEMMQSSGVMLAIPEHVLSFKLCGLQRMSDNRLLEAGQMVAIQRWMNSVSRDILDECDFTLATRTQLIYPSGAQLAVDGHPHRWKVTETILSLVSHHLRDLAQDFSRSIDVIGRGISGFPVAYFLRRDVEEAIVQRIVDDVCGGRTSILPMRDCSKFTRDAIRAFISQDRTEDFAVDAVSKLFPDAPHARKNVYLLRGLLAHGILLLCLKKRWNVQYGIHPRRDPVAVPFHAKGVPSEQAEWGHPDVAILFTCLAFYYQGLNPKQLRQSLQIVLKSDDPTTEYDQWTHMSTTLPDALRHWNIINVDDDGQVAEIWRHLRYSTHVINYFLNHFVFPAHAKQFSIKLQASGWDVPLFSLDNPSRVSGGGRRPGVTTGFSGTNDNKRLLPMTIKQHDLPGLSHTNAEVLTYLLQNRNRGYMLAADWHGRRFSEIGLLRQLRGNEKGKEIRVLIDAGAYILQLDNQSLVKAWLQVDHEAQAAVYFGADSKPWVQYKTGKTVPLLSTPFADNLEDCLVYLDEAHTRGTDLKFPANARGALTLGLSQTKDHTVQAAMRMRQLGTTQSISFVAPPEVHQSILDLCQKDPKAPLDSSHVIAWLLDQTCTNIQDLQPLYFAQGKDFCRRTQAAATWDTFLTNIKRPDKYLAVIQQQERQDLEDLYCPVGSSSGTEDRTVSIPPSGQLRTFEDNLQQRQHWSQHFSVSRSSALEEVEQEREVAFEVEEEREVQRPQRLLAHKFPGLHPSIYEFACTGLLCGDGGYSKASMALDRTQLAQKYGIQSSSFLRHLYISDEFVRTVSTKGGVILDNFTRPITWILWSPISHTAMVVIPEEAELLIPLLRQGKSNQKRARKTETHLLTYAAPVTRKMVHFDHLDYYSTPQLPDDWQPPPWLPFELGILGGRLYFDYAEYLFILESLGLDLPGDSTNTAPLSSAEVAANNTSSNKNVLVFLAEWLSVRRQGQDITHTPMGYVCQGWLLRDNHPFFARDTGASTAIGEPHQGGDVMDADDFEDYVDDSDEGYDGGGDGHIGGQLDGGNDENVAVDRIANASLDVEGYHQDQDPMVMDSDGDIVMDA